MTGKEKGGDGGFSPYSLPYSIFKVHIIYSNLDTLELTYLSLPWFVVKEDYQKLFIHWLEARTS